jgi:membrane protease YdiL (CAAX protease family)
MSLTRRLLLVAAIELVYMAGTRAAIHYFSWKSIEAESIRTALRLGSALAYWWLLKPVILSRKPDLSSLRRPSLLIALLAFLSVPVLIGSDKMGPLAILFAISAIPVGVKEELLFRGIVQNLLAEKLGAVKAILLTSVVFTVWHVGVWAFQPFVYAQIFLAGIFLGVVYLRSGSLLLVIAIHALFDALYSLSPILPTPINQHWGYVPLAAAVLLAIYWASSAGGLSARGLRYLRGGARST